MRRRSILKYSGLAALLPALGRAQTNFPAKAVTIIISFTPGGGTDMLARTVAQKLSAKWKVPVVVDNRPGGNGIIGGRLAANAPADGYTLHIASSDHFVLSPAVFEAFPFDPVKSFAPISPIANTAVALVVHPSVPATTFTEFVSYLRANSGRVNFASWGAGGTAHMAGEMLQQITGTKLVHIPYKGTAPAMTDLLSGRDVKVMFATVPPAAPYVQAGRLRALAIAGAKRSDLLPNVPTMVELGQPQLVFSIWNGLMAPRNTPPDVLMKIWTDLQDVLDMADVQSQFRSGGFDPFSLKPDAFKRLIDEDSLRWNTLMETSKLEKVKS